MIRRECYTKQWIQKVSDELKYPDVNLIEKVIRAFSLVEMLSSSGCPFVWKGGTSLMLLLEGSRHRLSIDVDVICPPGTEIENYLKDFRQFGFLDVENVERVQRSTVIPKTHSKFFYKIAFRDNDAKPGNILLDVLYEDSQYNAVKRVPVRSPFIELDGEPLMVNIPSVNDILGDKLTAFAPNTSGIPYFKGTNDCNLEIIKQLYDIGRLFDAMDDLSVLIRKGIHSFERFDGGSVADLRLSPAVPVRLGKLRLPSPEAYYYWVKTSELLAV